MHNITIFRAIASIGASTTKIVFQNSKKYIAYVLACSRPMFKISSLCVCSITVYPVVFTSIFYSNFDPNHVLADVTKQNLAQGVDLAF